MLCIKLHKESEGSSRSRLSCSKVARGMNADKRGFRSKFPVVEQRTRSVAVTVTAEIGVMANSSRATRKTALPM
jgi:hypothetical protein